MQSQLTLSSSILGKSHMVSGDLESQVKSLLLLGLWKTVTPVDATWQCHAMMPNCSAMWKSGLWLELCEGSLTSQCDHGRCLHPHSSCQPCRRVCALFLVIDISLHLEWEMMLFPMLGHEIFYSPECELWNELRIPVAYSKHNQKEGKYKKIAIFFGQWSPWYGPFPMKFTATVGQMWIIPASIS